MSKSKIGKDFKLKNYELFTDNQKYMEEEVAKQVTYYGGPQSQQVQIRDLDIGQLTPVMKNIFQQCKSLESLSLININMGKLLNLPQLKFLLILNVSRNYIRDPTLHIIPQTYPLLEQLDISDNMLHKGYTFQALKNTQIEELHLKGNPICTILDDYRKNIFNIMKSLLTIDSKYRDGKRSKSDQLFNQIQQNFGQKQAENVDESSNSQKQQDQQQQQDEQEGQENDEESEDIKYESKSKREYRTKQQFNRKSAKKQEYVKRQRD